jgi:TPR repeat protein
VTNKQESALDTQVSGDHYKKLKIQVVEYAHANELDAFQFSIIKYATRHKDKGGAADLRKAIHWCELALEMQYGEKK